MQINSFYLNVALASVLLYCCNGTPPKNSESIRFSDQERELMFNMLQAQAGSYDPSVWTRMQKASEEKVKAKVKGFVTPRDNKSLQKHFLRLLKNDKIRVPEAVREVYEQMKRASFTREEQDFINELLQTDDHSLSLYSDKRWRNIQKKHEEKHRCGEVGFAKKRSACSLRKYFERVMTSKNLVVEGVKRKFPDYFKTEQDLNLMGELLNQLDDGSSTLGRKLYSEQEHELLIKMLESHVQEGSTKHANWKEIEKAFEEKRKAHVPGFVKPRSAKALYLYFLKILRSDHIQGSGVIRKIHEQIKRNTVTPQEEDLINRELSRSDLPDWPLSTFQRWKKIEDKHDENRLAGKPGFANKRSWRTLRNHFYVMKSKNLVDEAVKKRFPYNFETDQGATYVRQVEPSDFDLGENMECEEFSYEDDEVWIDEYGVDPYMFHDPIVNNNLYEENYPYEFRTFEA